MEAARVLAGEGKGALIEMMVLTMGRASSTEYIDEEGDERTGVVDREIVI
jgi:hypothetical protein